MTLKKKKKNHKEALALSPSPQRLLRGKAATAYVEFSMRYEIKLPKCTIHSKESYQKGSGYMMVIEEMLTLSTTSKMHTFCIAIAYTYIRVTCPQECPFLPLASAGFLSDPVCPPVCHSKQVRLTWSNPTYTLIDIPILDTSASSRRETTKMPLQFMDEVATQLPKYIPLYRFDFTDNAWRPCPFCPPTVSPPNTLQIITWNVDAKRPHRKERLRAIIDHLATDTFKGEPPTACFISLQEVHKAALRVLLRRTWIRENFLVTPSNPESWVDEKVGVVSLVTKDVPASRAFIIDLPMTTLGRQALFLDLHLSEPSTQQPPPILVVEEASGGGGQGSHSVGGGDSRLRNVRIANCHLESGGSYTDLRAREKQLCHVAKMLNVPNLDAYICAGSLSSCRPDDTSVIAQAGFEDSYKSLKANSETWGSEEVIRLTDRRYAPGRLDRIVYFATERSNISVCLSRYRLGIGTFIRGRIPVSDHYGLLVTLDMEPEDPSVTSGNDNW